MSSVENFFEGKSVFITGGTGFVGKVLVEKLLRTFGGLKNVFVLIRSKRNGRIFLNFR
jgi:alcohol-forming fatty acyl-CoA reductase